MEFAGVIIALISVGVAIFSLWTAHQADVRSTKAESIKELLENKEYVAYAALKLLRDGLPAKAEERQVILLAVMQAVVFQRSDRARALLYRVIELNRNRYRAELESALCTIRQTFDSMDRYQFTKDELDLRRGRRRLGAVAKVVGGDLTPRDAISDGSNNSLHGPPTVQTT